MLANRLSKAKAVVLTQQGPQYTESLSWNPTQNAGLIIRPLLIGICQSDVKESTQQREGVSQFGHELVGRIEQTWGETKFILGDLVSLDPNISINRTTGFTTLMAAESSTENINAAFYKLPKDKNLLGFIFVEPLACALHCINQTLLQLNQTNFNNQRIAIVGAGTAGTLIASSIKQLGGTITLLNQHQDRLDFLHQRELFSAAELKPINHEPLAPYDIVIISTKFITHHQLTLTMPMIKNGGLLILYGGTKNGDIFQDIPVDNIRRDEKTIRFQSTNKTISITGTYGTDPHSFLQAINWLDKGMVNFEPLITHEIELKALPETLEKMATSRQLGKVIIRNKTDE